jgi:hypothetical protein
MSPLDPKPPARWQLNFLVDLINLIPIREVEWLLANGNLEYYTQTYVRAQELIIRLDHSATKYQTP